jgi:hypothetical protein
METSTIHYISLYIQGDSGGPLVRKIDGSWTLVGIVSAGIGCGQPSQPGLYARVTKYTGWIRSHMRWDRHSWDEEQLYWRLWWIVCTGASKVALFISIAGYAIVIRQRLNILKTDPATLTIDCIAMKETRADVIKQLPRSFKPTHTHVRKNSLQGEKKPGKGYTVEVLDSYTTC